MLTQYNIIVFKLNLISFIIFIVCFVFFTQSQFCFAEKLLFNVINNNIRKEYNPFFLFKEQDYNFSIEVPKKIFENHHNLKYQIYIRAKNHLDSNRFIFVQYSGLKEDHHSSGFKNTLLIGTGYNVFRGPVVFFQMKCSPAFYYIIHNDHQNNCFKSLIYSSGIYTYQLINNVYHSQSLDVLANFKHIRTKFEDSLNVFINDSHTILLKCSYNIILNENKFHNVLPNVSKYVSVSFTYFL